MVKKYITLFGLALDRIGAWATGLGVLAGIFGALVVAMTWLWHQVSWFGPIPWPEAIFLGIGAAIAIILGLSVSLFAWRFFRPLRHEGAAPIEPAQLQKPTSGNDFFQATVTVTDPPPFNADHVYVGQILVEIDKAESDHVVYFVFRCFNGSGNGINIKNPKGRVRFSDILSVGVRHGDMPAAPFYVDGISTENIKPGDEFDLRLEQRITKVMAAWIAKFPDGKSFEFDFEGLDIPLESVRWHNIGRLKLWDGVVISRGLDQIHVGKIVAATGKA